MKEADEKNGVWRTIGGRRIFIRRGENLTDAMKRSGKFKNQKKEKEEKSNLKPEQLKELHNHIDNNIKFWKEEDGMTNKEIIKMLESPEERPATDDGLWDLKTINMDDDDEEDEVVKEYLRYIKKKLG